MSATFRTSLTALQRAQKTSKGAPAYSRLINRPLGRVFAAWTQQIDGSSQGVYARPYVEGSGWGTTASIAATTNSSAYYPDVVTDADRKAFLQRVAWVARAIEMSYYPQCDPTSWACTSGSSASAWIANSWAVPSVSAAWPRRWTRSAS